MLEAIALMIYQTGARSSSARGSMIEKVLFLIEKRHFLIRKCHFGICWDPYVGHVRPTASLSLSGDTHDPPQTARRHRHHRFRRPNRLLGYDGSEDRHSVPSYQRFVDLHQLKPARGLAVGLIYAAASAALRSSDIARTTVPTSSGTHVGGGVKATRVRGVERTPASVVSALNAMW